MKVPLGKSVSCTVDKYIGSDYDAVKEVADNLDIISALGPVADGLKGIIDNLDDLVKLNENLEENQIVETVTLVENQLNVTFNNILVKSIALFVVGPRVDSKRLLETDDYTISNEKSIQLRRNYPVGTKIIGIQTIVADKGTTMVYDDRTVFNREVVPLAIGTKLKDDVYKGIKIKPLLTYKTTQYICTENLDIVHTIKSNDVFEYSNKEIRVLTTSGDGDKELIFNPWNARALPQEEIIYLFQEGMQNLLIDLPRDWSSDTLIASATYHIEVDGVNYIPKKIPFTTAGSWGEDIHNWLEIKGKKPCVEDLTGKTSITICAYTPNHILQARESVNITSFSNANKYQNIILIPDTDKTITLVHSDTHLRLLSGTSLELSKNAVYHFFIDHNGIARQAV